MTSSLGFVDMLIKHIDSNRKIWHLLSKQGMSWIKPDQSVVNDLVRSPKFTLPTLGQFYRPLIELQQNNRQRYAFYIEGYEIDMLRYPPYDLFVLEFKGHDQDLSIQSIDDVQMDRYILQCRRIQSDGKIGIGMKAYYFNDQSGPIQDGKVLFPAGWSTNGIEYVQHYEPPERRWRHPREKGYLVGLNTVGWHPPGMTNQQLMEYATALWPEFRALYQFLVVMNVKHGVTHTTVSTPKSKTTTLAGRRLGYEYHVLQIDPEYVAESVNGGGTHASPRYHVRRAHLRHYSNGKVTFVKQMYVGNPLLGSIDKDYKIGTDK
jgi:hypothetical protein